MKVVDLSQEVSPESQVFPAYPRPCFIPWTRREVLGFQAEVIFMATHTGTHVDAPIHFDPAGRPVSELPPEALMGSGVVVDASGKAPLSHITSSDIQRWEDREGVSISRAEVVLIRTGWDRRLGSVEYLESYPGLSGDAAEYIASARPKAIGVDSPNPDHPLDSSFTTHNTLLPRGVLIIENLASLESLPPTGFRFIGLPLKLRGLSGSPIRAIALTE